MPQLTALLLCLLLPASAHAYLDPNSAGMLYQAILPLLLVVAAAWSWVKLKVLTAWYWVKRLFVKPVVNSVDAGT